MSILNLETLSDLEKFFTILAEESVKDAKSSRNKDPAQVKFERDVASDEEKYGGVTEQGDKEDMADDEISIEPDTPGEEIDTDLEVEEETADASTDVSLDSISVLIKQLRSGKSVDDSEIKNQLRIYFDRLDEAERKALLVFLKAFSGILTGVSIGNDAPDPSDPPWSVSMSQDKEEKSISSDVSAVPAEEEEEPLEKEPEDSAPPIKVGETQSLSEIRKRVRILMDK